MEKYVFEKPDLKVVVLGDINSGKTCLVHRYLSGKFNGCLPPVRPSANYQINAGLFMEL